MQNHEHDLHVFSDTDTSEPLSSSGTGNTTVTNLSTDGDATGSGAYWYGTKNMRGSAESYSGHSAPEGTPRTG